ncbi:MAG: archaemetzincin family Zn-dependent metalloprotease [Bacteroidales bacterium]
MNLPVEAGAIILVSCGHFDRERSDCIASDVESEFGYRVFQKDCSLEIDDFYNPARRQYDANALLHMMTQKAPEQALKVLGMVRVDLYIPILTYIFGQARLNGRVGVASLYRLRNEHYGLEPDNALLTERFSRVVIHELGHTFGLIHCTHPVCVMRSSTYVEDLDLKEKHFCPRCRAELLRIRQLGLA